MVNPVVRLATSLLLACYYYYYYYIFFNVRNFTLVSFGNVFPNGANRSEFLE